MASPLNLAGNLCRFDLFLFLHHRSRGQLYGLGFRLDLQVIDLAETVAVRQPLFNQTGVGTAPASIALNPTAPSETVAARGSVQILYGLMGDGARIGFRSEHPCKRFGFVCHDNTPFRMSVLTIAILFLS